MTGKLIILVVSILIMLMGCNKSSLPDENRSSGEIAFKANCQTCHILPKPHLKTDEEWPSLVARYGDKAKLSPEAIASIITYVMANN